MKKLYISADIEGIWGNGAFAHTAKNGTEYEEYRTNMISGCFLSMTGGSKN